MSRDRVNTLRITEGVTDVRGAERVGGGAAAPDPTHGMVPGHDAAVAVLWADGRPVRRVRVPLGQQLALGRDPGPAWPLRVPLPQPGVAPPMSRTHLLVSYGERGGWRVSHLPTVKNPGRVRHWGDLTWRPADALDIHLRDGLVAYLFPGEPRHLLTVSACDVRMVLATPRPTTGIATVEQRGPVRIGVTDAGRVVLTDALVDAVVWPPAADDGRVRGWSEVGRSRNEQEAARAADRPLKEQAEREPRLGWRSDGTRGVDPVLLRRLVDVGEITYADVHRQRGDWPHGGLMPTQHTHHPDGRRRGR